MQTLTPRQSTLVKRGRVHSVPLVKLETFTNHDLETVDETFYFSDRTLIYPYEGGVDRDFWPVLKELGTISHASQQFPSAEGLRDANVSFSIELHNQEIDGLGWLSALLRAANLDFARLEYSELLLEDFEHPPKPAGLTGVEHKVRYRGAVVGSDREGDTVRLELETDLPALDWLIGTDDTTDPLDRGVRAPVVVGSVPRVPAIGWEVGFVTTLAVAITDATTGNVAVTSTAGFPVPSGTYTVRIGSEELVVNTVDATTINIVSRGQSATTANPHGAGAAIVELITTAIYMVASHEVAAINDVYVRSPVTAELVRVTSAFTKTPADTTTVPGRTVATISFTTANLRALLDLLFSTPEVDVGLLGGNGVRQQPTSVAFTSHEAARDGQSFPTSDFFLNISTGTFTFFDPDGATGMIVEVWVGRQVSGTPSNFNISGGGGSVTVIGSSLPAAGLPPTKYSFQASSLGSVTVGSGTNRARIYRVERQVQGNLSLGEFEQQATAGEGVLRDGSNVTGINLNGATRTMTFPAPPSNRYGQRIKIHHDISAGGSYDLGPGKVSHTPLQASTPANDVEFESTVDDDTIIVGYGSGGTTSNCFDLRRCVLTQGAAVPATVTGADVGFGLRFFADVDGAVVPSADVSYTVAAGVLIETPADVLRYILQELAVPSQTVRESEWPEAELANMSFGGVLNDLGVQFDEVAGRAAYEGRHHLFRREGATATEWSLIGPALVNVSGRFDFEFGDPATTTLPDYLGFREERRKATSYFTRFRVLYERRREFRSDEQGFASAFRASPDENDLSPEITTSQLGDFEDLVGAREHPGFAALLIQEEATARELAAFIVWNHAILPQRSPPAHSDGSKHVLDLREVAPQIVWELEVGDTLKVDDPEGVERRAFVVEIEETPLGSREIRAAETI